MEPSSLPPDLALTHHAYQWAGKVWRLRSAIYGLKKSSKVWNKTLQSTLKSNCFDQSDRDLCLYVKLNKSGGRVFFLINVDDALLCR